jgi:hypothetical protein
MRSPVGGDLELPGSAGHQRAPLLRHCFRLLGVDEVGIEELGLRETLGEFSVERTDVSLRLGGADVAALLRDDPEVSAGWRLLGALVAGPYLLNRVAAPHCL